MNNKLVVNKSVVYEILPTKINNEKTIFYLMRGQGKRHLFIVYSCELFISPRKT